MIEIPTFSEQFTKVKEQETHEGKLIVVLETFLDYFPVDNAYLFRFSSIGVLGEGVIAIEYNRIHYIHEQRYDVRTVPAIMTSIQEKRASFLSGKELFKITSSNHILSNEITAFLVTPILKRGNVIAFIYSNCFKDEERIDDDLLDSITLFSKRVGELIHETYAEQHLLSKREFEVMKEIANGFSTKEIAVSLSISELTVKQYVKLARNKLNASNRAHAVANMYRLGIL
ncbi:response regulator transcription factor [Oceanobacillus rekensis]|uniref:response regulator transcription factor n=1 Tax=Oceanobacillus rekensis TaxID=937927 RepID=UPI000B451C2A|nr:helix-turn-helix transcriptional regulator [Oceanobacillus rekensis]